MFGSPGKIAFASNGIGPGLQVESFRRPGLSDLETLQAAFRAWVRRGGGSLSLEPSRIYDLGQFVRPETLFKLRGLRNAVLHGNGATLHLQTMADIVPTVLQFSDFSGVEIRDLNGTDSGYDASRTWRGANIIMATGIDGPCHGLHFGNFQVRSAAAAIVCTGSHHRISGISLEANCRFENVYYGVNCQENGDYVTGEYTAVNTRRPYFAYGVSTHDLIVNIHDDGRGAGAQSAVLIKRYQRDTRNIRLTLNFSGVLVWQAGVTLEHQPDAETGPGFIDNIDIRLNFAPGTRDPGRMTRLAFRSYTHDGVEETALTNNVWGLVRLSGDIHGTGMDIHAHVRPRRAGRILIEPSRAAGDPQIQAPGFQIQKTD